MANIISMDSIYKATALASLIPIKSTNLKHFGQFVSERLGGLDGISDELKNFSLPKNFPISELAGTGDLGYGFFGAKGGVNNDPFFLKFSNLTSVFPDLNSMSPDTTTASGNISVITNLNYAIESLSSVIDNLTVAANLAYKDGLGNKLESTQKQITLTINVINSIKDIADNAGIQSIEKSLNNYSNSLFALSKKITESASFQNSSLINDCIDIIKKSLNDVSSALTSLTQVGLMIPGLESINSVLSNTLSQDWNVLNAELGNTLIQKSYLISGRDYIKDGKNGPFSWSASFVGSMLGKAGIPALASISPAAYQKFGMSVDFHDLRNLRTNDILLFKNKTGITTIGFLKSFDPLTRTMSMLSGNVGGGSKLIKVPLKFKDPTFYITHVRRAWKASTKYDVPTSSTG